MNARHHSRSKIRKTNSPVVDHLDKSHSGIESFMRDENSCLELHPTDTAHQRLIEILNRFLPASSNVRINFKSIGQYSLVLRKTVIDITFRDDAHKILLTTIVYQRDYNKLILRSLPKVSSSHQYIMLAAMMKFKVMLNRSDGMESITSLNGKFIYFQEVDFEILQEKTRMHRILEGFILRSYEMSQDFYRISKMHEDVGAA